MTKAELAKFVDTFLAPYAQEIFARDHRHAPIAFVQKADRLDVALLTAESAVERRAFFETACRAGALAVAFISEAWVATAQPGADLEAVGMWKESGRSLADLPGRTETLMLSAACPAAIVQRGWRIERAEGKAPRLVAFGEMEMLAGIFAGLPWQAGA